MVYRIHGYIFKLNFPHLTRAFHQIYVFSDHRTECFNLTTRKEKHVCHLEHDRLLLFERHILVSEMLKCLIVIF